MTTSVPVNLKHTKDIHPELSHTLLGELLHPERSQWTTDQLQGLTATIGAELSSSLLTIVRFDVEQRWWARLALTMGVELWLLSWAPGQGTEPHDHGGACGSFTMLLGQLAEQYVHPGSAVRSAERHAPTTVAFGSERAHQLSNNSGRPAVSVHAYSPPLLPTREYRTLADYGTGCLSVSPGLALA